VHKIYFQLCAISLAFPFSLWGRPWGEGNSLEGKRVALGWVQGWGGVGLRGGGQGTGGRRGLNHITYFTVYLWMVLIVAGEGAEQFL
jgi:hypothetical protein